MPRWDNLDELRGLLVPGIDCKSLVEYLTVFDITCAVLQTHETLERAAYEMGIDAANEGVRYLEVRFAPRSSPPSIDASFRDSSVCY